jgi:tetratricopeptide (TPR) repeat protein
MHRLAEPEADLSGVDLDLVHPEDLLKPRAELEEIMAREKARRQVQGARRVAPPADFPPPPPRRVPEAEVKRPVPPAPAAPAPKIEAPPKKAEPADEYQRLLENGRQAFQQQLYGLAAQRFRQASQLKGADVQALFLLSQAQFALGQYARAVQTIHEGMRLDPQWPLAKFQPHVELYQGKDAFDVHLQRLEDVVAREPENARYLFLLGHELWFGGRRQRSLELFRRARPLADNPAFIDAFLRVGPVA